MKRMILSVLILLVITVSCAYKPEGKPVLVVENISWAKNPSPNNHGYIDLYFSLRNIGTSDDTMLKDGYRWEISSLFYKVIFTNGFIMTTNSTTGRVLDMGGGGVPNINQSLSQSTYFGIDCYPETAVYTNSYYTNMNFIEKIEFSEPVVTLGKINDLPF